MGLWSKLFGNNKKLPFSKTIVFERIASDYDINLGDEVNLWNKPNTNQVNLYAKGSTAGEGLVGSVINSTLSYHLAYTDYLFIECEVVGLTRNRIKLYVYLYSSREESFHNYQEGKEKWLKLVTKKYNPRSTWELRFFSEYHINLKNCEIATIRKDEVYDYYEHKDKAIWLVDAYGREIIADNCIRNGGTEKTLRAVFSGHEIIIHHIDVDNFWYMFEVGVDKSY